MKINSNICFTELLFCLKKKPFQPSSKMCKDGLNCFTTKMVEDSCTVKQSLWMDGRCQTHSKALKSFEELSWSDFQAKSPKFPLSMGRQWFPPGRAGQWPRAEQHRNLCCTPGTASAHGCIPHTQRHHQVFLAKIIFPISHAEMWLPSFRPE